MFRGIVFSTSRGTVKKKKAKKCLFPVKTETVQCKISGKLPKTRQSERAISGTSFIAIMETHVQHYKIKKKKEKKSLYLNKCLVFCVQNFVEVLQNI